MGDDGGTLKDGAGVGVPEAVGMLLVGADVWVTGTDEQPANINTTANIRLKNSERGVNFITIQSLLQVNSY